MALKRFDQDLLTRIFRKIRQNFASQTEMDSANERIDQIVAEGGEPNVIEVVKQNGTALEVTDKAVDVTVPTKVSELENDSGYVDEAVRPNILRGSNSCTTLTGYRDGEWSDGEWGYYLNSSRPSSIEISDAPVPDIKAGWKMDSVNGGVVQANVPIVNGETYRVSCYCRGKGTINFVAEKSSGGSHATNVSVNTNEWAQFYSAKFTLDGETATISFNVNSAQTDFEEMEICGMKLEEGTTATPWCPSYWDMENKNVDVPTKLSELTDDVGYATTTQLTDGSVTKVGTATVGSPTQGIYLDAGVPAACDELEIGGRNLILNSEAEKSNTASTSSYNLTDYALQEGILNGKNIVISCWARSDVEGAVFDVYARNSSGTNSSPRTVCTLTNEWQYYAIPQTVYDNDDSLTITLRNSTNVTGGSSINSGAKCYYRNVKCELGTIATDWTPALEEMATLDDIPTKTSDLTNDSGYTALSYDEGEKTFYF